MNPRLMRMILVAVLAGIAWLAKEAKPLLERLGFGGSGAPQEVVDGAHGYDLLENASLVSDRGNDGDSFHIRHGGKTYEMRLYYVDTPEKSRNFPDRVRDQARYFGCSENEAIEIGKAAREFTLDRLDDGPFDVVTNWEDVYNGDRHYCFIRFSDGSDLAESLIKAGLARIHTKGPGSKENPVPNPDGRAFFPFRDHLRSLEATAKRSNVGGWAY